MQSNFSPHLVPFIFTILDIVYSVGLVLALESLSLHQLARISLRFIWISDLLTPCPLFLFVLSGSISDHFRHPRLAFCSFARPWSPLFLFGFAFSSLFCSASDAPLALRTHLGILEFLSSNNGTSCPLSSSDGVMAARTVSSFSSDVLRRGTETIGSWLLDSK